MWINIRHNRVGSSGCIPLIGCGKVGGIDCELGGRDRQRDGYTVLWCQDRGLPTNIIASLSAARHVKSAYWQPICDHEIGGDRITDI